MGNTTKHKLHEPTKTWRLNSISSGICLQNTHFNMHARTSKLQEGFKCKDFHAKCSKTTNSTAKLYLGVMYRGEVLRVCFRHFLLCFHFIRNLQITTRESNANSTKISIHKTQFLTCNNEKKKRKEGSLSKHCSRNVLKWQILIDSIIP